MSPILSVEDVTLRFGALRALDGVSFAVRAGSVTALIGPNGAGKTSLFNCVTGMYRPTSGRIVLAGEREGHVVSSLAPHRIAALGVSRTFQNVALFRNLSVFDNILMGRYLHGRSGWFSAAFNTRRARRDETAQRERVEDVLDLLEIQHVRHTLAKNLPFGLQKRVELGKALVQDGRLLLLDEPMAGMTAEEKQEMGDYIAHARASLGTTMLLVEHDMAVVMRLAEHIVVLDFGTKLAEGPPEVVREDPKVIAAYLGASSGDAVPGGVE